MLALAGSPQGTAHSPSPWGRALGRAASGEPGRSVPQKGGGRSPTLHFNAAGGGAASAQLPPRKESTSQGKPRESGSEGAAQEGVAGMRCWGGCTTVWSQPIQPSSASVSETQRYHVTGQLSSWVNAQES